jgi:LmbE family N-acetylglucosaminyl deacetylase
VADGWKVDLLCAIRADEGGEGEERQKELQKAGIALGLNSITFLGYKEGTLSALAAGELEDTVYKKTEEFVPDAVITMDTTGISNDPDHIKMCFVTTYAFQKYAAWIEAQLKDQEEVSQAFPKLYYVCMPESVAEYQKKKKLLPATSFGKPWFGVEDKNITTVINIAEFSDIKKKALVLFTSPSEEITPSLLDYEYFILRMQGTTEVFMGKNDHVANNL